MDGKYIIPVVGQIYTNRNGGEYRCVHSHIYMSDDSRRKSLLLGEHTATMERVKDGWSLLAHGVIQYEDGTIEWNYSTGGYFPR